MFLTLEGKRQMRKILTALCLLASVSGPALAETEIDRLVAASRSIANKLQQGRYAVGGLAYYAVKGKIAPDGTTLPTFITPADVDAYNNSVNEVSNRIYYNTQMMLENQYEETMIQLETTVDTFVEAAATLAVVTEVAEKAEDTDQSNTVQQEELQDYIVANDVSLNQQDVNEYNNALSDIETYSQNAAAFLAASKDLRITDSVDSGAQSYNLNMSNATATYNKANQSLSFSWTSSNYTHGFYGFFDNDMISQQEILGMGQTIYEDQEYN